MACNCIKMVQEELKRSGSNTRLDVPFGINLKTGKMDPPMAALAVVKAESKSRERAATIFATYCPFCGTLYEMAIKPAKKSAK